MEIIPVIDVKGGVAVRAVAGDRANYRPLETPLALGTSVPVAIARGYLELFPFKTLYLADLDGIEGKGANGDLAAALSSAWQGELWLDNGARHLAKPGDVAAFTRARPVLGSETGLTREELASLHQTFKTKAILSLDFRGDKFQGDPALLEASDHWPRDVIVMTLASVGADQGPDVARVRSIVHLAQAHQRVYAAGGVRNKADLEVLADAGASGALVASALHTGQIKTGDLEEIAGWS
jgi:HisA/HisF family protein